MLHAREAAAQIRVEVEGVSGPVKTNVLAFLSLNRYAKLTDLDQALVERLQDRADREVADALRPFGYYSPELSATLSRDGAAWVSRLEIRPGAPTLLDDVVVRVEGAGTTDPAVAQALAESPLAAGQQLNHPAYDRLKSDLMRRALAHGYLDARWVESTLSVDPDKQRASVHLVLSTGERYRFGAVTIEQTTLKPALMHRYLRFKEGDWFDSGQLLRTQFALDDSAYFGSVEVLPGERDHSTLTIPVVIRAAGAKRNKYTLGAGYSTDQLWRATGTWDNRLLNDSGHRVRVDVALGTNAQSYGVTYTIPVGDPALEKLEFGATQSYASPGDVRSTTTIVHSGLTQVRGGWQYVPSVDFAHTESLLGGANSTSNLIVPGLVIAQVPRGFMSNVGGQSSIIGATPGASGGAPVGLSDATGFYAQLQGSTAAFRSDISFLQLRVRDQWRFVLAPQWRLLLRAEVGMTLVHDFGALPVNYRFFTGGDQTVRGYAYQSLSPVDAEGQKAGGKDLLVLSTEIDRELGSHVAIAAFCDGGNALMRFGDPLAYGAGVGIRYRLPFLSMGIDVAKPLSNGGGSPRLHLNISPVF